VEAVSVGREGMLGLHALLGASTIPAEVVVQIGGHALAVGADVIGHVMAREPRLHVAIHHYAHGLIVHAMQSVACSRLHSLEERFCRWILGALDCIDGDRIPVTQELLAATLGVRRPSLTLAARALQESGAISYRRGEVRVQQRPVLEATACECYAIVRKALALEPRTAPTR
jgi:CRP-like cAMP-binding protein